MSRDIIDLSDRVFVIHYHEIGLKGRNRDRFEEQLCANLRRSLAGVPFKTVRRISGRLLVVLHPDSPQDAVARRLRTVFGIAYTAHAVVCDQAIETIQETAWNLLKDRTFGTFKIDAKRSEKRYPLTSVEINIRVGETVRLRSGAKVQLNCPELTCYVEVVEKIALLFTDRLRGLGGLPLGVSGKAVSLLSSGIDSPVASYRIMKRGVEIVFVHFHSQPYTNRNSQRNVEELVSVLTRHQYRSTLYLVPFIALQERISAGAPASHRVVLYRRAMVRIAERVALKEKARALVTGENIGQVASQTLSNILVIDEAASLPVLRPLAGDDKEEIIAAARRIGTYDISIEPYEDSCSLFVPKHPETHANLLTVQAIEAGLDLDPILEQALASTETKTFEADFSRV